MKEPLLYKIVRPVIVLFVWLFYHPKIIGRENIPKTGRVVLVGNHTNNFDCLLLIASVKRVIHFLAKDSLYKGWKKTIFKNMGIIPVDRSRKNPESMQKAKELLNEEKVIGIFPEGTINKTSDILMPFKMGAVKMAYDTDALIIPFAITGKYKIFRNNLQIKFDKSYKIRNNDLENENKILMNKVIELIKEGNK